MTQLFVVGRLTPGAKHSWEFMGVFDTASQAQGACRTSDCFIGPIGLNENLTSSIGQEWPDAWFPFLGRARVREPLTPAKKGI